MDELRCFIYDYFVTLKSCGAPQICEDIPQELDSDVPGLAERPINIFLTRLFQVTIFLFFGFL